MKDENYKIIKDSTIWGIQMTVNQMILEGWETQGPLIIDKDGDYVQSLVKKVQPEQEVLAE